MIDPGNTMATALHTEPLVARNPATGAELGRIETTPPEAVAGLVAGARQTQADWSARPLRARVEIIDRWRASLARGADAWADAICTEAGKPRSEAALEVVATLDALRWTARHAARALADERLAAGWQRLLMMPRARIRWRPLGVVGILGTWNYPLYLTAPAIADALIAGNGVVWKPSELIPMLGWLLQDSLEAAGVPDGLGAAIFGGPEVGRALCAAPIDKGHFTGGIAAGRQVLASLAARGIPATAELSGFDPAILLPDAPRESTVRALTWAAFVNAGQTCIAVKRAYLVGDPAPWVAAFTAQAKALKVGDPARADVDVGPLISESARDRFDSFIRQAIAAGARVLTGGTPLAGPGWFYRPTVLLADPANAAPEAALAGCFGPVLLLRGVPDADAAIAAANAGEYGLAASVWGRNRRVARTVAARIESGMVMINDAVAPSGNAAAPFGGIKASGFGRTHGVLGLREFVQPQTVHDRRAGGYRPQLFPYQDSILPRVLTFYRRLFHGG